MGRVHRATVSGLPRTSFFLLKESKLTLLVQATIAPKKELKDKQLTREGYEIRNEESNPFGGNKEFEGALRELSNMEVLSNATNGGLQQGTHRDKIKLKLTPSKSNNQRERGRSKSRG